MTADGRPELDSGRLGAPAPCQLPAQGFLQGLPRIPALSCPTERVAHPGLVWLSCRAQVLAAVPWGSPRDCRSPVWGPVCLHQTSWSTLLPLDSGGKQQLFCLAGASDGVSTLHQSQIIQFSKYFGPTVCTELGRCPVSMCPE